jgi:hypothetical protein
MKTNLAAKLSLFIILLLAIAFVTGCKSAPQVDWNSRVGSYTYDQAVTELGPPDKQAKLDNGETVSEWVVQRGGESGFSVGTGFVSGPVGVGVGQSVGSGNPDRVLKLTFGTDGKLAAWSRNY